MASVFGKLALDSNFLSVPEQTCQRRGVADLCHNFGPQLILVLRAASLGLLVVSNIVMTTSFARAMHLSSSFMATVATTSFNFTFTAILSMLVFGETLPPLWWGGFTCILLGLVLLASGAPEEGANGVGSAGDGKGGASEIGERGERPRPSAAPAVAERRPASKSPATRRRKSPARR
eukprot:Tamp_26099.p1 GENE.Tamp_26099~~Tamp_26099.p1  ORF type:complete len:196 (+),score=28.02 Tamp_26099:60-590(+)